MLKVDNKKVLIAIIIATLATLLGTTFNPTVIWSVLVFPVILFLPGYSLLAALFPENSKLDGFERVALSFGISIAVVPLMGLILNYTPLGITVLHILISTALLILASSAVALYRQGKIPIVERFTITVNISLPKWHRMENLDKVLSSALVVAIVSALGFLIYFGATPNQGERFTEFYILDAQSKAENYPRQVMLGEPVELIIGIVNHEYADTNYRVTIGTNGLEHAEIVTGSVANNKSCYFYLAQTECKCSH